MNKQSVANVTQKCVMRSWGDDSGKCMLHSYRHLSSDCQPLCEKPHVLVCVYNSSSVEGGGPLGLVGPLSYWEVPSEFSEKEFSGEQLSKTSNISSGFLVHTCIRAGTPAHMYTFTHTCMHMCASICKT